MGIFGSQTKTHVGTVAIRAIEDTNLPNSAKTGVVNALFGEGQLVENILEAVTSSIGLRADRMYDYAKTNYIHGLPASTLLVSNSGEAVVLGVLRGQVGSTATQQYHHFGPLNRLHVGWLRLVNQHGYDSSTNRLGVLSTSKGTPVYLKDMQVVVSDTTLAELSNGSLDQWGTAPLSGYTPARASTVGIDIAPTPFHVDPAAASDYVKVSFVWNVPTVVVTSGVSQTVQILTEDFFNIPITGYPEGDYFQVKYLLSGKSGYWLYRLGEGTSSSIEAIFNPTHSSLGSFMPFTYFRYGKVAETTSSAGYATTKKMVKSLGMDYQGMIDNIHSNADIADVEQAIMMFAVPANTVNPLENRYLFDFFCKYYDDSGAGALTPAESMESLDVLSVLDHAKPRISMYLQDARFKMVLSCLGMFRHLVAGSIGAVGSYSSGLVIEEVSRAGTQQYTTTEGPSVEPITWVEEVSRHYYRHQVSDAVYEEVQVFGMQVAYYILGNYKTIGDLGDDILLIPVDVAITSTYPVLDRETLLSRSLHYIFNSLVVEKIRWYQTSIFRFITVVVAVVLAAWTGGASLTALAAEVAAMTVAQLAMFLLIKSLVYVLTLVALKLFVKAVGIKAALVVALVAAAYGLYIDWGAEAGGAVMGVPWAGELLTLSNGLMSSIQKELASMMQGLQGEAHSFLNSAKEQLEALEESMALIDRSTALSPFTIFGETPKEFYNRSLTCNIGALGLDAVSSYVSNALTLPKIHQTV